MSRGSPIQQTVPIIGRNQTHPLDKDIVVWTRYADAYYSLLEHNPTHQALINEL
ncbi:MAG: hypothetical protein AAF557_01385 [Pseudomonadota bacterium]